MSMRWNVLLAWFLLPQVLAMGWVAALGRLPLSIVGMETAEEGIPGRIVGAILVFAVVYYLDRSRGGLPPQGNPEGNGFELGRKLVLAANGLAAILLVLEMALQTITDHNVGVVVSNFSEAFGYWVMGMWAVGFSMLYQSAQPAKA